MSEKFRTYASGSLSEERIEEVIGKVEKLEDEKGRGETLALTAYARCTRVRLAEDET